MASALPRRGGDIVLYVENLPPSTTSTELKGMFEGRVRVSVQHSAVAPPAGGSVSQQYGFVTFCDAATAQRALSGGTIGVDGRSARIQRSTFFEPAQVRVGGLAAHTTEDELRASFEEVFPGRVRHVQITRKHLTSGTVHGYVTFWNAHAAQRALALDGTSFYGHIIRVETAPHGPGGMPFLPSSAGAPAAGDAIAGNGVAHGAPNATANGTAHGVIGGVASWGFQQDGE